ncbi:FliM/FliN family flagellar motor switch protein [Novosphingobium ginsenosidimutans]|uniref:FliM/FliN family flagellar motor switch protein n=1 Tax=Novosphingobium ginsenosidimutans TaxID=1176536 RepID=A0A5B8S6I6_9SPHN|nr:FliM/FliN family flagellar motor switch protein [Novosphingobium ginsenosidimutans]QEA16327.1 FliM/FliN family flagellar motor switch protein [Novosphingobium ginsenosidimutans]
MSQPHHRFVAAGRAAQHCPELTARGPGLAELRARWAALGPTLAEALAPRLAPLLGGKDPQIAASLAERLPTSLAAHALIAREGCPGLLHLVIDGPALLRIVDRTFGGNGAVPHPLPEKLPASALMLAQRIEALACAALAEALPCAADALAVYHSAKRATALPASTEEAAVLTLSVGEPGGETWPLTLALPVAALAGWLGTAGRTRRKPAGAADPAAAPFSEVPLPLSATLVDMRLPLAVAATLEPGMVLPVAVARAVPLAAGGKVIARGTVGHQDDRVALKLTQIA